MDLLKNQSRISLSAQIEYHDCRNQECNKGDQEPKNRNFRPHPMEENGNNIIGSDLSTSLKPEIDFANEKPHADVQVRNSVFLNRSEITTIISEEAPKAPSPIFHAVRSEELAQRVLQERQQQETCHFLCFE